MKKLTRLFLFAALAALCLCTFAGAETFSGSCGSRGDNVTWTIDTESSTLTLSGSGAMQDYAVYQSWAPWYPARSLIQKVIVGEGITSVGNGAFYGCSGLKAVELPESLSKIGSLSFSGTSGLEEIQIPDSVTKIGQGAFSKSGLRSVEIPAGVKDLVMQTFLSCTALEEVVLPGGISLAESSFADSGVKKVYYGGSQRDWMRINSGHSNVFTEEMGVEFVFYHNAPLSGECGAEGGNLLWSMDPATDTLTISGSGEMKGPVSWSNGKAVPWRIWTDRIKAVVVEEGVASLGRCAFIDCTALETVTLPESLRRIDKYAFKNCTALKHLELPAALETVADYIFTKTTLETLVYHGSAEQWDVLYGTLRPQLLGATITLADGTVILDTLPGGACGAEGNNVMWELDTATGVITFSGSGAMKDFGLNESGVWASWSKEIKSVVVEEGITHIGAKALERCNQLTEVRIPEGVTSIGDSAFHMCSALTDITLPESLRSIGNHAFASCNGIQELKLPEGLVRIGDLAFSELNITEVVIPESVTELGIGAFQDCRSLTKITLPDNWTVMGGWFMHCTAMEEIVLPDSVTELGEGAFFGWEGLTKVVLPARIKAIGPHAFSDCRNLTEMVIPEGVTALYQGTLFGCDNLSKLYLPASLETVEMNAFHSRGNLELHYAGTEAQWEQVAIEEREMMLWDVRVVCNSVSPDAPEAEEPGEEIYRVLGTVSGSKEAVVHINGEETPVNAGGSFVAEAPEGIFDVVIKAPGCLSCTVTGVKAEGSDVMLPAVTLVKGDTNNDGMINIVDMGIFRQNFGKMGDAITNIYTDTNGDKMVNIIDMSVFRTNFGKTKADCVLEYSA